MADPTGVPLPGLDPDERDPWGPFRVHVTERLEAVAEYVAACWRTLDRDDVEDEEAARTAFGDAARDLRTAALILARDCRDVERWLHRCEAQFQATALDDDGVGSWLATCALPADHACAHHENPPATTGERIADAAETMAAGMVGVADYLREATIVLDHRSDPGAVSVLRAMAEPIAKMRQTIDALLFRLLDHAARHDRPAP